MAQVTWRAPDELVDRVRMAAADQQRSLNDYLTRLAQAATNPDLADDDLARTRERLARAGIPAAPGPRGDGPMRIADFEADYFGTDDEDPRFAVVAQSPEVLEAAARFTGVHRLRAYDAVQLATAVIAAGADPDCTTFAAADAALRHAAAAEGFALVH